MSRKFQTILSLISLLMVNSITYAGGQRKDSVPRNFEIEVFVYNYAQVPGNSLERAKREAARIFHHAGVELAWRNCPLEATTGSRDLPCEAQIGPTIPILRVIPRFEYAPGVANKQTLGSSVGNLATVSYQWVRDEAAKGIAAPSEILGPAVAHELGHLLLTQRGHAAVGIMRARWSREDFQRSPLGAFTFTREQADSLRSGARVRARARTARLEQIPQ